MEILGIILMLLTVLAAVVGVISLIVLIIMAISKKRLKVPGIITGASFGLALIAFVSFIILVAVDPETYTAETSTNLPNSSADANSSDDEVTYSKPNTGKPVEVPQRKESSVADDTESDDEVEEETDLSTEELDVDEPEEVTEDLAEETPEIDPEDLSNYRTDYDIKDVERNPAEYKDELLSFEGKIIQVMEDEVFTSYRIAINGDYDRIVYLQTFSETLEERLLEDDYVTVYGIFDDLLTYETVLGANQTVPAFIAHGERIILSH
ncbi:hypothetical protein SAMN05216187_1173 [Jeotgalicoccus aerolatus]|uniref:Uncharacterized protein n=1 Tax=Jeotgalicoccus aerolatus TaxID=709510 RepID=A0A1G9EGY5_9STAP|nr:hypothetical protein [Jeotgalicoccus aerolatus]SDK75409.1 hypothetical protein SAMN05216187_1173 [Jeotgalicoccus aerolatus]